MNTQYNYSSIKDTFNTLNSNGVFDKPLIGSAINDLKEQYPELMNYAKQLQSQFNLTRITEALYWIKHDLTEYPHCQYHTHDKCDDHPKFINYFEGYRKGCKYCGRKNPDILQKQKEGSLKKYGVENAMMAKSVQEKQRKAMMETYGGYGWGSKILNDRFKKSMLEKHGVDNAMKKQEFVDKMTNTIHENYNNDAIKNEIVQKKHSTEIERYGDVYSRTDEFRIHHIEIMNSKPEYREYAIKKEKELRDEWDIELLEPITWGKDKYPFKCLTCGTVYDQEDQKLSLTGIRDGKTYWCTKCYPVSGGKSRPEYELKIFFQKKFGKDFKIIHGSRSIIPNSGKELDLYFPDYKIAIEYCGLIYHANKGFGYQNGGYDPDYHYEKFKLCQQNGIKLISLFENEWFHAKQRNNIKNRILKYFGVSNKCSINLFKHITQEECQKFLDDNTYFTQFLINECSCFGLYCNENIVGVIISSSKYEPAIYIKNDVDIVNLKDFLLSYGIIEVVTDNRYPITYDNLIDYSKGMTWESFKGFNDMIYKTYPERDSKPYVQINDCGYSIVDFYTNSKFDNTSK